eukprot:386228-Prymnesium_polylepis.1
MSVAYYYVRAHTCLEPCANLFQCIPRAKRPKPGGLECNAFQELHSPVAGMDCIPRAPGLCVAGMQCIPRAPGLCSWNAMHSKSP